MNAQRPATRDYRKSSTGGGDEVDEEGSDHRWMKEEVRLRSRTRVRGQKDKPMQVREREEEYTNKWCVTRLVPMVPVVPVQVQAPTVA